MKNNFPLFEKVARMLEVPFFEEKLEQLKTATHGEDRQWLRGLMREPKNGQEPTTMVDGGTSFRLATWPSHLIVCLWVYMCLHQNLERRIAGTQSSQDHVIKESIV